MKQAFFAFLFLWVGTAPAQAASSLVDITPNEIVQGVIQGANWDLTGAIVDENPSMQGDYRKFKFFLDATGEPLLRMAPSIYFGFVNVRWDAAKGFRADTVVRRRTTGELLVSGSAVSHDVIDAVTQSLLQINKGGEHFGVPLALYAAPVTP